MSTPHTLPEIDYTLFHRRQVLSLINRILADPEIKNWEVDQILEEMMRLDCDISPILVDRLVKTTSDREIQLIAYALSFLQDDSILLYLVNILTDPQVQPAVKYALIPTFVSYDIQPNDPDFAHIFESAFGDIANVIHQSTEDILDSLGGAKKSETLAFLTDSYSAFPLEAQLSFIKHFGRTKDPRVVDFLNIIALQEQDGTAELAVYYLGKVKNPVALSTLIRLKEEIQSTQLQNEISRAIQFLSMMEIQPKQKSPHSRVSLGAIFKVLITHFDNMGSRIILFSRRSGDTEQIDTVNLMVKTTSGIVDCFGVDQQTEAEFDDLVESIVQEVGYVEVSFNYAMIIIRDALFNNQIAKNAVPANFFLLKYFFGDQDLSPTPHLPKWSEYGWDVEAIAKDKKLVETSAQLIDSEVFLHWPDRSSKTRRYGLRLSRNSKKSVGKRLELENHQIYKSYAVEVMEPLQKIIQQNLFLVADLLAQQGTTETAGKLALAAALTIDSNTLDKHPFVSAMIDRSLKVAMEESQALIGNDDIPILSDKIADYLVGSASHGINLNTATIEELVMLPGIGTDLANRVVEARPYTSLDELMKVKGIGRVRFDEIKNLITVEPKDVK